jgi:chromosome segregation ATPase
VKVENETLKRTNDEIKAKESQILAKVSDIRSKLALAEAENARLKKELASRPLPQAGPSVDERLSWRKEKATLETEVRMMKRDAEERAKRDQALHVEQQSSQVLRAENERLKYGCTVVAEQYAELYELSTEREKQWLKRSRSMEGEKRQLESNVAYLQEVVTAHQAELEDLKSQLDESNVESEALVDTVDDLRTALLLHSGDTQIPQLESMVEVLGSSIDASDVQQMIELLSGHVDLVLSDCSDTPSHIASLTESILKLEIDLRQSKTSLSALEASQGRTELELETLKVDHATCGATTSQLRFELDQAGQIIESRGQEVSEVRIALGKAETRAEKHAELLARANEQAARSKFAEEALEEAVTQYVPVHLL